MISQVEGLAKEFNSNFVSIKTKLIFPWSKLQPGILPIFSLIFLNKIIFSKSPEIIISCGRKSVYLSIYLKKKYKNALTIHIQNPKIDFKNFDYIVAPFHDNINGDNILNSIGALHRFNENTFTKILDNNFNIPKKNLISIIVGGNNRHYNFTSKETDNLILMIKKIKKSNIKYNFLLLFSRRSSKDIRLLLNQKLHDTLIVWNDEKNNPYTFALKNSDFFIVTSDSTSMISECAFTGKPIYVFHLPFKRKSKRMEKFHDQFRKLNITKDLKECKNILISWTYKSLNESKRIAGILKERIIKEKV